MCDVVTLVTDIKCGFHSAEILKMRKARRHMPAMMSSYIWCQSQQTCSNRFYTGCLFGQIY